MPERPPELADNCYQIRLPLPFLLNHVHDYALRGPGGWSIVDTGLNWPEAQVAWQAAFTALGIAPRQIEQIILTHFHPDHYGLAGWLQGLSGAPVWMSARDAQAARTTWMERDGRVALMQGYFARCGFPDDLAGAIIAAGEATADRTAPHPADIRLLDDDAPLMAGGRSFRLLPAPGHSDGQRLLYDASDRLLLSGDQVLNGITPNIGLWPDGDPAPLERYLASLAQLAALDVRLALPGHKSVIYDWGGRIAQLQAHHAERLTRMQDEASGGASVFDVARAVFDFERLTPHELRFAAAETLAHLDYLQAAGALRREERAGQWWYAHA